MYLIHTMKNTIANHDLIQKGDRIILGVSGGADSVCLLTALNVLKSEYNLTLVVCHVNHKVRPGAAERDQEFVKNLCEKLGVEYHVREAEVEKLAKEWNMGTEEAGRKVRYDFFEEIANGDKIATAHNQNDNVETVMMRILRGTGLQGLAGIPYRRNNIIRPLLDVSRIEIEAYLAECNQDYVTDATNFENIYTRNKIRLNLIPEIVQEFNPNFMQTLSRNISGYKEDNDCLNELADDFYKKHCFKMKNEQEMRVSIVSLSKQPVAIVKRVITRMIQNMSDVNISSIILDSIVENMNKKTGTKVVISDDCEAMVSYDYLHIGKPVRTMTNLEVVQVKDMIGKTVQVGPYFVKTSIVESDEPIVNNEFTYHYPVANSYENLMFRTRRAGDMLQMTEHMSKKVNRFFTDKKIPASDRDNFWMLSHDGGIGFVYWIPELFGSRWEKRTGKFVRFEIC